MIDVSVKWGCTFKRSSKCLSDDTLVHGCVYNYLLISAPFLQRNLNVR